MTSSPPKPCAFLDRDGTICREAGYINHPDRIELLPGAAAAIRKLNERGVLAIVTTNQSGVARGYFNEALLARVNRRLEDLLAARGAKLDAIFCATNHPEAKLARHRRDDGLRKPGTGMIELARKRFSIDMARSCVIGDRIGDVEMARRAGIAGIFTLTGYGLGEYEYHRREWKHPPDFIAKDLREAVNWYLKGLRARDGK